MIGDKQLQFELWQECNSQCKFCYLGKENLFTPDKIKLSTLKSVYEKISDMSNYPEYNTLAYLGGEFFQGQLKNPEVKSEFMKVMNKTADLLKNGVISHVWIYATMTLGDQSDLFETLKLFEGHKGELWILTSYDTVGRFHTEKMRETWSDTMLKIHELYPEILFNITTILTGDLIEKYLNNEISFKNMMDKYHCAFFFKQPGFSDFAKTKEDMNKRVPNFFPKRSEFIKFLIKFRKEESPYMWDKLFNIQYRADSLYRNFNDESGGMVLNKRNKHSKNEISIENKKYKSEEELVAPCGHMIAYSAYIDSDKCCLCDKHSIESMYS